MSVLAGIRVLDFGRYVAGPYCATMLGSLGADVIRIERIQGGDDRDIAPLGDPNGADSAGAVFMQTGGNKKSIALKFGSEQAKEIVNKLVASADVVVANFPPAAQRKLSLDYAALSKIKPNIIFANATAFGEQGPMANQGGFDGVAQAMSGAMHISGVPGAPVKAAAPYADFSTAVMLAFGVMAALRERDQTGQGQQVSGSLLGTAMAAFNSHLVEQSALELDRSGSGNRVQTSAPSDVFVTLDGHVLVHCPGDGIFARWANFIGKPEWLHDPRFANDQMRGDARDILCAPMVEWCIDKTTAEVLKELNGAGIPAGEVLSPRQALAHPQVDAMNLLTDVSYPHAPNSKVVDLPLQFTVTNAGITQRPPLIGEHTLELLSELGYSNQQIKEMQGQQIIAATE